MNRKSIEVLGDYDQFYAMQAERLRKLGIDIDGLEVSHESDEGALAGPLSSRPLGVLFSSW